MFATISDIFLCSGDPRMEQGLLRAFNWKQATDATGSFDQLYTETLSPEGSEKVPTTVEVDLSY
jgi:hypothetical protein